MLYFVGPLPPPLHGFSFVNSAMLAKFVELGPVKVFNRAPKSRKFTHRLASAAAIFRFSQAAWKERGHGVMYIGLSGGFGQLIDLLYIVVARSAQHSVVVHHHSFAYMRKRTWYSVLCLGRLRDARHIVLCEPMAALLASAYDIARNQIEIISNAAFLPNLEVKPGGSNKDQRGALRLGFLSNITSQKGIFLFFEVGEELMARGIPVLGLVAGPVAPDIMDDFQRRLDGNPWCRALGAVYGSDKNNFFESIDVLLFPTLYANEAEPVTILESLRAGVPVVGNQRGCIRQLINSEIGEVFDDSTFVTLSIDSLTKWYGESDTFWTERQAKARLAFKSLREQNLRRLEELAAGLNRKIAQ